MTELQLSVTAAPLTTCWCCLCSFDAHIAHTPRCAPCLVQLSNNCLLNETQKHSNCIHTAFALHSFLLLISNSHTDTQNKMHSCRNRNKNPNSTQFFTALFAQLQTQTMEVWATVASTLWLSDSLSVPLSHCTTAPLSNWLTPAWIVPVERQDSSN